MTDVKPGQIWADNDWRSAGRTLRVLSVDETHAVCEVVTNDDDTQDHLDNPSRAPWYRPGDRRGKQTRIMLRRFKPTSTGYRLVSEADA